MKSDSMPSAFKVSPYSFGNVIMYWVEPSGLCISTILRSTIFGMLILIADKSFKGKPQIDS